MNQLKISEKDLGFGEIFEDITKSPSFGVMMIMLIVDAVWMCLLMIYVDKIKQDFNFDMLMFWRVSDLSLSLSLSLFSISLHIYNFLEERGDHDDGRFETGRFEGESRKGPGQRSVDCRYKYAKRGQGLCLIICSISIRRF